MSLDRAWCGAVSDMEPLFGELLPAEPVVEASSATSVPAGSSGSEEFDRLRDTLRAKSRLREELEWYCGTVVANFNPTSAANRFISGALVEWGLALAGWAAGVFVTPDGHDAVGHDLSSLRSKVALLWSVKSSNSTSRGYKFTLTNTRGTRADERDQDVTFVRTVFLHPLLPGILFVDPEVHPAIRRYVAVRSDSTDLGIEPLLDFATEHPECVAPFTMPANPKAAIKDPAWDIAREMLSAAHFTILGAPLRAQDASNDKVAQVLRVKQQVAVGVLEQALADRLIEAILRE